MTDKIRDLGRQLQRGIRDAHAWTWGPLSYLRAEYPDHTAWALQLGMRGTWLQISLGKNTNDPDGERQPV